MNGTDTFLDINNAHLRVNSGNVQASTFVLDQINIVTSANTNSTVNFNNVTKAFNAASNIEVGTANLFVDTSTSNVGIGTDAPQDTLHINGGTRISGHILPTVNDTYDLGSAEYKIRHLFLGNTSLWLGDETRITFTGGKMKFRRRKKNALPRGLATIAANRGHTSEQQTTTAALAHAGVATIEDMKLEHWIDYTKTLDETKEINDIFTEDANDYEATTASEAFKEIGEDSIYSPHSVAIGKTTAPTSALDVVGTVKATAFEGDGSALTGITSGQWTESGGNIYRSSGNVGIGTTSADTKLHLYATGSGNILDFKMSGSWSTGDYYRIIGYNTAKQIQFNYNDGMWLSDNNSIRFGCGGTQGTSGLYSERMRITNAGDVGIGKTPDSGKKLDVNGTIKATAFEGDGSALTGISASGGGETVVEVNVNAPNVTSGSWSTSSTSGTAHWGPPKFNSTYAQYAYTDGTTAYRQWNIPTNMKSAYVSQLQWSSGGYADIHGVRSDGALVFLKRINTFQNIENSSHSGDHDGSTITFIGSGLQYFTAIRISNRLGRLHLTGLAFTDKNNDGTEGTGMVHSKQISDFGSHRPLWRASYTSTNGYRNVGTVPFNRAEINQRNGYSTSTGLFTAPEAGHYWVYAQMYSNSSSGKDEICFIINGSASITRDGMAFAVKGDTIPHFVSMPLMTTLWLNVNDTIGVYVRDAYAHYNSTGVAYFGGYRLA